MIVLDSGGGGHEAPSHVNQVVNLVTSASAECKQGQGHRIRLLAGTGAQLWPKDQVTEPIAMTFVAL
eukprot:scaffold58945_cov37-Tisochrysis_lutea.AAC.1